MYFKGEIMSDVFWKRGSVKGAKMLSLLGTVTVPTRIDLVGIRDILMMLREEQKVSRAKEPTLMQCCNRAYI